jgi:hypothetical protein
LFVVLLVMAPSSQELGPPANPGRFSTPEIIASDPRDFARTVHAIELVAEEMRGGPKADLKGKEVKLLNHRKGENFDLRPDNLAAVRGRPRGGGWQAVADVRKRWGIRFPLDGSPGQSPRAVFAATKRAEKAAKRGGPGETHSGAGEGGEVR